MCSTKKVLCVIPNYSNKTMTIWQDVLVERKDLQ